MNSQVAPNPYVGPRSFTREDASWFFGRERELQELIHLTIAERIVLLYSPSGAGKTSLLQAGLNPALRVEGFRVLPVIRVNMEPPLNGPANRFVASTIRHLEDGLPAGQKLGIEPAALGGLTIKEYLDRLPRQSASDPAEDVPEFDVLIFDQFEEILTIEPASRTARKARIAFFGQVASALSDHSRWAVFSLREDYLAGLDPYRRAVPTRLANHFRLDLLQREDARQAIIQPPLAMRASPGNADSAPLEPVTFADDAVTRLLNDLGGGSRHGDDPAASDGLIDDALYIEPIHLQLVCDNLWEQLQPAPGAIITPEQIEESGDVDTALREYYDRQVARIAELTPDAQERDIRDWFEHGLILREQGIRGQVAHGAGQSGGLDNDIVAALVDAKLVNRETRLKAVRYELAHDRMIGPVLASNASWARTHLSEAQRKASGWDRAGQPPTNLLGAREWAAAKRWSRQPGVKLRDYERRFIDQSGAVLARRIMYPALAIALAILGAVVFWRLEESSQNERATILAIASGWADSAFSRLPQGAAQEDQLDLGLLLAVEAVEYLDREDIPLGFGAKRTLFNALVAQPHLIASIHVDNSSESGDARQSTSVLLRDAAAPLAISDDGRLLATTSQGQVVLLELSIPRFDAPLDVSNPHFLAEGAGGAGATALALSSPDSGSGMLLSVGNADGSIGIWNETNRHEFEQIGTIPAPNPDAGCGVTETDSLLPTTLVTVTNLIFDGGDVLAAGYSDGAIGIWNVLNPEVPEPVDTLRPPSEVAPCGSGLRSLAFTPQTGSGQIVAGYATGAIWPWEGPLEVQEGGEPVAPSLSTAVEAIAITEDGRFMVFGGQDGLFVWRLDDRTVTEQRRASRTTHGPVTSLAMDPLDPSTLFSGHANGEIVRWDMTRTANVIPLPTETASVSAPTGQAVVELALTADGRWLSSRNVDGAVSLWNPIGAPPIGQPANGSQLAEASCVVSLSFDGIFLRSESEDGPGASWDLAQIPTTPIPSEPAASPSSEQSDLAPAAPILPTQSGTPGAFLLPEREGAAPPSCEEGGQLEQSELDDVGELPDELTPDELTPEVVSVATTNDGNLRATGDADGAVVLWEETDDGWEMLGPLPGHAGAVTALAFDEDGRYLASGDAMGVIIVWHLEPEEWVDIACARAGRSLTKEEVVDHLHVEPEEWEPSCE
ncbi:MAG: hypothetical protein H0U31_01875 [Chloroflexia bacterium]|nr:hypothetical protein [Chloroflexia bacterium]